VSVLAAVAAGFVAGAVVGAAAGGVVGPAAGAEVGAAAGAVVGFAAGGGGLVGEAVGAAGPQAASRPVPAARPARPRKRRRLSGDGGISDRLPQIQVVVGQNISGAGKAAKNAGAIGVR